MPTMESLKREALESTRGLFRDSPAFGALPLKEQKALFSDAFSSQLETLQRKHMPELSKGMLVGPQKASDLIDDKRHLNKRIDQAGQLAGEFIDEIDFPGFVRDLLKGVFDANLEVTLKQMEAYQKLLQAATGSISKFVNAIDDTAAFGYLAENNSDEFSLDMDPEEKNEDGSPKAMLTDKEGNKLDLGDNEVKARIMDAKIAMAREHRAILRETILMGITRLVIKRGVVKAACKFDIKASEKIEKADKAGIKHAVSSSTSITYGGGFLGSIFGGPKGGSTLSTQHSKLSVSSAKSTASTDLTAQVSGHVEIEFMSDYFKLDNFATMYGPQAGGSQAVNAAGGGAPAAVPGPAQAPALVPPPTTPPRTG